MKKLLQKNIVLCFVLLFPVLLFGQTENTNSSETPLPLWKKQQLRQQEARQRREKIAPEEAKKEQQQVLERNKKTAEAWKFTPNPNLPNILILGDSNTIGYVLPLRKLLDGKANVYYPLRGNGIPDNCANSGYGLENIERFLTNPLNEKNPAAIKWDVIHFNWGLHDATRLYEDEKGRLIGDHEKGEWKVPLEEYAQNLEKIIVHLKQTGAKLIWATSSVVNKGTQHVRNGDEIIFNDAAKKVIKKNAVPIDDIYDLTKDFKPEQFKAQGNIHFSQEGFAIIAGQVAGVLQKTFSSE